ncbi:cob(I)yrinic acid a,c-diamide adenosyltransferase [Desulfurivibrio alkaliphilus]|uniref:corrinoid adenosyltransferase n=1 Tax=Desulfurivibrio alkaliphilus (strain DSM 19089 / UNIQEM U267 / AHT2) TaxID=589865 RepID=D6Z564_DESAT|nr:cob(I)yrinic acid a,c-diamide adenosyltransferase [Desulfurivibrio alkaliphilus]ADH84721.1 cob(I)alamin adenosyltransferase [Desulfurivibrio alkaliphilus AHT 2]
MTTGLFIIYTGHGKGKTCAAFGQALRAVGQGLRVCLIQFVKSRACGELHALEKLAATTGLVEIHQVGSGFSWRDREMTRFRESALAGWQLACRKLEADSCDLLILDEFSYLIHFGILKAGEVLPIFQQRPATMHLLVTGRDPGAELLTAADLVTEMQEIRHPFQKGIKAQKGIEW